MSKPASMLIKGLPAALCAAAFSLNPLPATDPAPVPAQPPVIEDKAAVQEEQARQQAEAFMEKLKFSEAQKKQARPLFKEAADTIGHLRQEAMSLLKSMNYSDDRNVRERNDATLKQSTADINRLRREYDQKFQAILTPEQKEAYAKLRTERWNHPQPVPRAPKPPRS